MAKDPEMHVYPDPDCKSNLTQGEDQKNLASPLAPGTEQSSSPAPEQSNQ